MFANRKKWLSGGRIAFFFATNPAVGRRETLRASCPTIRTEWRGGRYRRQVPPSPRVPLNEMCLFTKRTHRFWRVKMGLSICDGMSYAGKICQVLVGSFSETNPPEAY